MDWGAHAGPRRTDASERSTTIAQGIVRHLARLRSPWSDGVTFSLLFLGGVSAVVGDLVFSPIAATPGLGVIGCATLLMLRGTIARREQIRMLQGWMQTVSGELPDMLFEITPAGRFLGTSLASRSILGRAPEDLADRLVCEVTPDPIPFLDGESMPGDTGTWNARWIHADGEAVRHTALVRAVRDTSGHLIAIRGVLRSPDDQAETQAALRASEDRLRRALEAAQNGIMLVDRDGSLIFVNRSLRRMLGYSREVPVHLDQVTAPERLDQLTGLVASRAWADVGGGLFETGLLHRDGTTVESEIALSALREENGTVVLIEVRDLTESRRASDAIRQMADYDRLTGLPSRDLFDRHVQRAILDARQSQECVAVILLDLDRFKLVNDTLGHASGDRLLKAVADRLHQYLPSPHVVARFGGDEFLVLAPQLPVPAAAEGVARRVLQALAEPFPHEGRLLKVAASAGVALFPQHAEDPDALIRIADGAIHIAKDDGGDCFRLGTAEDSVSARDRLSLEADLREAVEQHAFEVYYQPQVDTVTQELRGVEALLRWRHAVRGSVSPADFIPLLEETGLIVPVGEWVLEQSCQQMQEWIANGFAPLRMAVNLSPRQLMVPGLGRVVRGILERTGLQPELLELELTETTASLTMDAVIEVLHELHAIGITTAIDDFGIGHSWLGRLRQFPVQTLKIDRSFIHGMDQSIGDRAIVEAVVALGHALGLTVVAEGVESERDLDLVRKVGCDLVQGYYYSPAVDASVMATIMRDEDSRLAVA